MRNKINNWSLKLNLCQVWTDDSSYRVPFSLRSGRCNHNKNRCWKHPQEGRWGVQPPWPRAGCRHHRGECLTGQIVRFASNYQSLTMYRPHFSFNNGENCLEKAYEGNALLMWASEDVAQICNSVSTTLCSLGVLISSPTCIQTLSEDKTIEMTAAPYVVAGSIILL